jgi:hypothetical protein
MIVEIGTEAAKFPEKEYISGIFLAVLHRLAETHQQKNERISIDIVTIIGCHRPEAQIGIGGGRQYVRVLQKILQLS